MNKTMKNDPAFPTIQSDNADNPHTLQEGLTKREYFAAKAMQGLFRDYLDDKNIVERSVKIADLLIEELNK
jgi:hypothetical protein